MLAHDSHFEKPGSHTRRKIEEAEVLRSFGCGLLALRRLRSGLDRTFRFLGNFGVYSFAACALAAGSPEVKSVYNPMGAR